MAKIKKVTYICVICGGSCAYSTTDFSLCERCQALIQEIENIGLNRCFFIQNFLWIKELGDFYKKENFGTFDGLVKEGKIVKTNLALTLLYKN